MPSLAWGPGAIEPLALLIGSMLLNGVCNGELRVDPATERLLLLKHKLSGHEALNGRFIEDVGGTFSSNSFVAFEAS